MKSPPRILQGVRPVTRRACAVTGDKITELGRRWLRPSFFSAPRDLHVSQQSASRSRQPPATRALAQFCASKMPPRLSLLQAPRQRRTCLSKFAAPLSTTARKPASAYLPPPLPHPNHRPLVL